MRLKSHRESRRKLHRNPHRKPYKNRRRFGFAVFCVAFIIIMLTAAGVAEPLFEDMGEEDIADIDIGAMSDNMDDGMDDGSGARIVITCGGDTTLGCTAAQRKMKNGFDAVVAENGYSWAFSGISDILAQDDMTLVNFEGTLTESGGTKDKLYNFKGPAEYVNMLTFGSVEAVNIANNHILDYGRQGKDDTIRALEEAGILVSGEGMPAVYEVNGVKIGLIGNTFPYNNARRDISRDVKKLREQGCRIIIASFHWGSEYDVKYTQEQRKIGRAAINAGADIVIGHHPHVVQGIELYKGKYILYSLGNLVFGGNTSPDDRDAYMARLTFRVSGDAAEAARPDSSDSSLVSLEMIPIRTTSLAKGTDYRPVVAEGTDGERIRDRVLRLSANVDEIRIYGQ